MDLQLIKPGNASVDAECGEQHSGIVISVVVVVVVVVMLLVVTSLCVYFIRKKKGFPDTGMIGI